MHHVSVSCLDEREIFYFVVQPSSSPQDYSSLARIVNFFKLQAKRLIYKNQINHFGLSLIDLSDINQSFHVFLSKINAYYSPNQP